MDKSSVRAHPADQHDRGFTPGLCAVAYDYPMTDPSPYPETNEDAEVERDPEATIGLPRWVKVSAIVVAALIALLVTLRLSGIDPGGHDPGGPGDHGLGDPVAAIA
jgi:hypothetical protein